jgi:signal transduction histidine kinase
MMFALIALWTVSALLLISDPRSPGARRLAAVSFFGGTGALAAVLDGQIIPNLAPAFDHHTYLVLYAFQAVSSVSSYYGLPYAFVLFALAYRPIRMPYWLMRSHPWLLLLPIAACLVFTPLYTTILPITFSVVVWWAVPYLLGGILLILTKRPRYRGFDRTHWIVCLAVLPPVLVFMVLNYVLPSLGYMRMWVYNTLWVGFGFGIFLVGLFTYGFLGVRLAIDRKRMDSTLRAVTSGTAILNHAIKNDVGKMKLFGDKIKKYAESTGQPELLEDIRAVLSASAHIQEMISRVHRKTEDLAIRPETTDLGVLIRDTLRSLGPRLHGVTVRESVPEGWQCRIDPAQVGEALQNIMSNAIEAMGGRGELAVRLFETKREWRIEMADNGRGMNKEQAAKALEPFHSTKGATGLNFGLGLPYSYHVMRKHGGMLLLRSESGAGTTVCLVFPKRAVQAERSAWVTAGEGRDAHV